MLRSERQPRPRRGHRMSLALMGLCMLLLVSACGEPVPHAQRPYDWRSDPEQPHPLLERDLAEIRRGGTLRMIAFYNLRSYFVHKGGQAGFDYELVARFARERQLTLEVVVAEPGDDLITMLNTGQGDLVCTGAPPKPDWGLWVRWTRPTNFVRKIVVTTTDRPLPRGLDDLAGLTLAMPDDDPDRAVLQQMFFEGDVRPRLISGPPQAGPEEVLELVREGKLPAAVVDDLVARAALVHAPGLQLGPALGERRPTAWLVRENSNELLAALNQYLKDHLQISESGRSRRSRDYGITHERYFSNQVSIRNFRLADHRPDKSGRISVYDAEIQRQSGAAGLDWRLVSALMFQESRFDPGAVSQADARGLMQVLPRVAGAQADSLFEPEANIRAGIRILSTAWQRYAYLDSLDQTRFTLAENHAGFGHLNDARRLTMDIGRDPNSWDGGVAETLPLLMQRRFFRHTRHGYYGGRLTVAYVHEILGRYRAYIRLVPREPLPIPAQPQSLPMASLPEARPAPP